MNKDALYIIHIQECLGKIDQYLGDSKKADFLNNGMLQDAVVRNLQIMSVSTQKLSDELKKDFPEVEWHKISGFRKFVVHECLSLDVGRVWLIIENELPILRKTIGKIAQEI